MPQWGEGFPPFPLSPFWAASGGGSVSRSGASDFFSVEKVTKKTPALQAGRLGVTPWRDASLRGLFYFAPVARSDWSVLLPSAYRAKRLLWYAAL